MPLIAVTAPGKAPRSYRIVLGNSTEPCERRRFASPPASVRPEA